MKYSDLSDFEINKLVAEKLGYRVVEGFQWEKDQCWVKVDKEKEHTKIFDYCGDANDAWPIVVENKLWIQPDCVGDGFWHSYNDDFSARDKNPLRAAMIVFLMMNEGEIK